MAELVFPKAFTDRWQNTGTMSSGSVQGSKHGESPGNIKIREVIHGPLWAIASLSWGPTVVFSKRPKYTIMPVYPSPTLFLTLPAA